MTYKSADLVFDGDNVVGANGEFTMLGVTRPVALKLTNFKCAPNPFNQEADVRRRGHRDDQAFGVRHEGGDGRGER
jgi:polyisoprenoid-binding protein YceI